MTTTYLPVFVDMGGVDPEDLAAGTYILSGGSAKFNKPPVYSIDQPVSLFTIEDSYWGFDLKIVLGLEFVAALVGPAAGYSFTAALSNDPVGDTCSLTISGDQIDSGIEFGCQVTFTPFTFEITSGDTIIVKEEVPAHAFDLIGVMKFIVGAIPELFPKFNAQQIPATIFTGLDETWGFFDPPQAGNTSTFPISMYSDIVSAMIAFVGGPLAKILSLIRGGLSLWDIYFNTGPGISVTMTSTFTPHDIVSLPNDVFTPIFLSAPGVYTADQAFTTDNPLAIWMNIDTQAGFGITWCTGIGLLGLFDLMSQPVIDTTELYNGLDLTSPVNFPYIWARSPHFDLRTGAGAAAPRSSAPVKVVFEPAGALA